MSERFYRGTLSVLELWIPITVALGAPEAPEGSPVDRWRQLCALLLCLPLCSHLPLGGSRGRRLSAAGGERAVSALLPARRDQPDHLHLPAGLPLFLSQLRGRHDLFQDSEIGRAHV